MTVDASNPSGNDKDNAPVENPPDPEGQGGDKNKVDYASYKKLLSEKKKLQAEFDRMKKESDDRTKTELENQQKYKELYESTKGETEKLREELKSHEDRWHDALKLNAFNSALGDTKKIDSKYYGFIDTSKILIDPDTNKVDPVSVQKEVDRINREYPEIIKSTVKGNLPSESPTGSKSLTYQEWLALPLKEMKARQKEVKD